MSVEATSWVLRHERSTTGTVRLILLGIADHADPDGRNAWPSLNTLARQANCSRDTAWRAVKKLVEDGVISRDVQGAPDARVPEHRRSNYYEIVAMRTHRVDAPHRDCAAPPHRGAAAPPTAEPRSNPSLEPPEEPPVSVDHSKTVSFPAARNNYSAEFETWWATYPRRAGGKKKAAASYDRARKLVSAEVLLEAAKRYAAYIERRKTPEDKIAHATSWLNAGRWDDELPGHRPAPPERSAIPAPVLTEEDIARIESGRL